jgi:hypothetical protein
VISLAQLVIGISLVAGSPGATAGDPFEGLEVGTKDPAGTIYSFSIDKDGKLTIHPPASVRVTNDAPVSSKQKKPPSRAAPKPPAVLRTVVVEEIRRDPGKRLEVIVLFEDDIKLPKLPRPDPAARRRGGDAARARLLTRLREIRRQQQAPMLAEFRRLGLDVHVQSQFSLINAVSVTAIGNDILRMATVDGVRRIESNHAMEAKCARSHSAQHGPRGEPPRPPRVLEADLRDAGRVCSLP